MGGAVESLMRPIRTNRLLIAAKRGDAKSIKSLIKGGARPNKVYKTGERALVEAVKTGNKDAVKQMLLGNADVNGGDASGTTALIAVCQANDTELLTILLDVSPEMDRVSVGCGTMEL
ncbi:KANK2, partial [Symbiodinium sp. KB8]